jgi:hypothetical protein
LDLCAKALEGFPGDAELLALRKHAEDKRERSGEIRKLIETGLELLENRQIDAALKEFRSVASLEPYNLQASKLIGVALLHKARMIMAADPVTANLLIEEARTLVPTHPDIETRSGEIAKSSGEGPDAEQGKFEGQAPHSLNSEVGVLPSNSLSAPAPSEPVTFPRKFRFPYKPAFVCLLMLGVAGFAVLAYKAVQQRRIAESAAVPLVVPTPLRISASPGAAEIAIDGKLSALSVLQTKLNPGSYTVTIKLAGYESKVLPLTLTSVPTSLDVKLRPIPLDLYVLTDQPNGRIWIDDEAKGNLTAAGMIISGMLPGEHKVSVRGPEGDATAIFDFQPGLPPAAVSLPTRRNPAVLFIGSSEEKSRVKCNCAPAAFTVGNSQQSLESGGLEMNLAEGEHQAELSILGRKRLNIRGSRAPIATVALYWGSPAPPPAANSGEVLLREANVMIGSRNYKGALSKVTQVLLQNPGDDRAPILQKRLQRLMAIDP